VVNAQAAAAVMALQRTCMSVVHLLCAPLSPLHAAWHLTCHFVLLLLLLLLLCAAAGWTSLQAALCCCNAQHVFRELLAEQPQPRRGVAANSHAGPRGRHHLHADGATKQQQPLLPVPGERRSGHRGYPPGGAPVLDVESLWNPTGNKHTTRACVTAGEQQ
jgi:hypothetical protein